MYVEAVITVKHQADGGGECLDVVVDNLLVDAHHECLSSETGGARVQRERQPIEMNAQMFSAQEYFFGFSILKHMFKALNVIGKQLS